MHYLLKNNPDEKEILYSIFLGVLYVVLFVLFSRKKSSVLRDFSCLLHAPFFIWRGGRQGVWEGLPVNGLFIKKLVIGVR